MTKKSITFLSIFLVTAVIVAGGILWYSQKVQKDISEILQKQNKEVKNAEVKNEENQGGAKDEIASIQDLIDGEYVFKPVDTSDWQTYRNEKLGFEVKYPKSWELRHTYTRDEGEEESFYFSEKGRKYFVEGGEEDAILISLDFKDNPLLRSTEELLKIWKEAYNISIYETEVDGLKAYYYSGFTEGVRVQDIPHKNFQFVVVSGVMTTPDLEKEIRPVLHGIIQSIRFF